MRRPLPRPRERGSALLISMIMIAVLTAIGVAAISLASRERQNAAAKTHLDALRACAMAAQAKVWAELARYGVGYLGSSNPITQITMPDGTVLTAPFHYDTDLTKTIKDVVIDADDMAGNGAQGDLTNGGRALTAGTHVYQVVAHCQDTGSPPRELEVEFGLEFAL